MIIKNKVVLITGANGGIGKCLVQEFIKRGAAKIYAADLRPVDIIHESVLPVKLDVTDETDITICPSFCSDVDIIINNAGVELASPVESQSPSKAKLEIDVNYLGIQNLSRAFWDILNRRESSAIINILSIASFIHIPKLATYCASKAAANSITQAYRHASSGTTVSVFAVYPGYVDTEMTKNIDMEKVTPQQIAANICDDFEKGILDIFPDSMSKDLASHCSYQSPVLDCKFKM